MLVGIFGDDFLFPFWWVWLSWRVEYVTWGCAYDISWLSKLLHFFWLQCCCRYVSCHEGEHSRTSWIFQISSVASAPKKTPFKKRFLVRNRDLFRSPLSQSNRSTCVQTKVFLLSKVLAKMLYFRPKYVQYQQNPSFTDLNASGTSHLSNVV